MTSPAPISLPLITADFSAGLCRNSRKLVQAKCGAASSPLCRGTVTQEYQRIKDIMDRNTGIYICSECRRITPLSGFDSQKQISSREDIDNFFSCIDSECKAYILGLNSSWRLAGILDGSNEYLSFAHLHAATRSQKAVKDICAFLQVTLSTDTIDTIQFPSLSEELSWAFIRGLFDGQIRTSTEVSIGSYSQQFKKQLGEFCGIKHRVTDSAIWFDGTNAIDFLSKIYDTADPQLRDEDNYEQMYLTRLDHDIFRTAERIPAQIPRCMYVRVDPRAIPPNKSRASDEGYDLHLIGIDKVISDNIIRYDTGIKIQPDDGWHVELLPRSSLSNSGWVLSNSVGLIDTSFRGSLKVCVTRADPQAKPIDITTPFKAVQMVFRRNVHFICEEEDELDDTARGEGGFGSTDVRSAALHG